MCVCLCVVCYVAYVQDVGVLSSAQNGGGSGGGHNTLRLSETLFGKGRVEGTDHGNGGLGCQIMDFGREVFQEAVVMRRGRRVSKEKDLCWVMDLVVC